MQRRRLAHLTTVDLSLAVLLGTELQVDVDEGWEVFAISAPGPWVPEIEAMGVTHLPVPSLTRAWDLGRDVRAVRDLYRTVRELDLDVLHTHNPKTGVFGRIVGRAARVPRVVNTCHGLWADSDDPFAKRAMVIAAEVLAVQFSHAELYQNDEDRRRLSRWVSQGKAQTVGNGIDLNLFHPDPEARRRVRSELEVAEGEVLVGGVGRQVAEKGIREFAVMAQRLGQDARFVWVGPEDPDKPDAVDVGASGVEALGLRRDMPAVYAALDIFVLPSYREGFSRSGMEAAASGCALVLSDIRGCREVARHGREGLLVPRGDSEALIEAVRQLIADPGRRHDLAYRARARALKEFDQRAVARRSLKAYER